MKERFKNFNPNEPSSSTSFTTANERAESINNKKKIKKLLKKVHKNEGIEMSEAELKELTANKIKSLANIDQIIVKIPYDDHTYALSAGSLNLLEKISMPSAATITNEQQESEINLVEKPAKKSKTLGKIFFYK